MNLLDDDFAVLLKSHSGQFHFGWRCVLNLGTRVIQLGLGLGLC